MVKKQFLQKAGITGLFLLITLGLLTGCGNAGSEPAPSGLMIDLLTQPENAVITNPKPQFSWMVGGGETMQTAYQIVVASSIKMLAQDVPDIWDSGKVNSSKSVAVSYLGNNLDENTSYWWKVRTWNQNGEASAYSSPQRFNTGDFNNIKRKWPGESRRIKLEVNNKEEYILENRQQSYYHDIPPVSVVENTAGNYLVTFDQAFFATLKLTLDAPDSTDSLVIHLGEKLAPGNQVDRNPGGSIIYQKEKLVLYPGKHEYLLELPRYNPRRPNSQVLAEHLQEGTAFRYVEIEGWPGTLKTDQVWQHALLYPFDDEASYFKSSNENLNQIWNLCKHSLKVSSFMGVYIDNATRERMPYEAESYMQQVSHYCVDREFAIQRNTLNTLLFNGTWPTEWHFHTILMAWDDYMATGNSLFLEKYYDELKKKTMLPLARKDGLISTRTGLVTKEFLESIHLLPRYLEKWLQGTQDSFRDIVDWPQGTPANESELRSGHGSFTFEGETDRYIFSDINTVVNAFHYRSLILMSKIAGVLDKIDDEAFFEERARLVKASFNEILLDKETGLYKDGENVPHSSFHANLFPVAFGLAPESNYPQLREFLISKGMACSPIKVIHLFDALYELGAEDYVLELLTSETDRSYMNMIRFGSTGVAEAWDMKYKRNLAWIQPGGATPVYTISRRIFGIESIEPSFRKMRIKPHPGDMEWAKIKHPTIRGTVEVDFKNLENVFELNVIVPSNSRSDIYIPLKFDNYTLTQNGKKIEGKKVDNHILVPDIGPGSYSFQIKRSESN